MLQQLMDVFVDCHKHPIIPLYIDLSVLIYILTKYQMFLPLGLNHLHPIQINRFLIHLQNHHHHFHHHHDVCYYYDDDGYYLHYYFVYNIYHLLMNVMLMNHWNHFEYVISFSYLFLSFSFFYFLSLSVMEHLYVVMVMIFVLVPDKMSQIDIDYLLHMYVLVLDLNIYIYIFIYFVYIQRQIFALTNIVCKDIFQLNSQIPMYEYLP